jgi:glutathione S-transferase
MSLTLYSHPFSSYCQKVLVALYENDVEFEYRSLEDPAAMAELKARWPLARFPVLVDNGRTVVESTIIIEHLMLTAGGRVRRTRPWRRRVVRSTWPMAGWSSGWRDVPGSPAIA